MARQVQLRRGTTAENDVFTGAVGELTMDTDTNGLRIHDGETVGGISVPTSATADYVVEWQPATAESGYYWWRKYKSGWVEQGAKTTGGTITLPVEMANTDYHVVGSGYYTTGEEWQPISVRANTTTTIIVNKQNASYVNWVVCGQGA